MIKRPNKKQMMIKKLTNIIIQSSIQYINEQIKGPPSHFIDQENQRTGN